MRVLIRNIGTLVTGDCARPVRRADSISVEDSRIAAIGEGLDRPAELVIDARGTTVVPGLIDSHSHPTFGDFTYGVDGADRAATLRAFADVVAS